MQYMKHSPSSTYSTCSAFQAVHAVQYKQYMQYIPDSFVDSCSHGLEDHISVAIAIVLGCGTKLQNIAPSVLLQQGQTKCANVTLAHSSVLRCLPAASTNSCPTHMPSCFCSLCPVIIWQWLSQVQNPTPLPFLAYLSTFQGLGRECRSWGHSWQPNRFLPSCNVPLANM
jgi:hypothetical protein